VHSGHRLSPLRRLRRRAGRAAHAVALATGWTVRRARADGRACILMLHGVGGEAFPADALGRLLHWLARRLEPVALGTLVDRLEAGRLTGREVALTFDDGLRNQAEVVAPLLRRHRVPATFFLCPGLVTAGGWLWNHEARARLASMPADARAALLARLALPPAGDPVETMKRLGPAERARVETAVRDATPGFEPTDAQRRAHDLVDWETARALDPGLVTIGSHTTSHPILTTLPDDALEAEVGGSRPLLEEALGRTVDLFCYPNGDEDDRVRAAVRRHYRAAVTTVPGTLLAGADPWRLPRVGAVPALATTAWRMVRP
jgi:peptidoglycan/xylan/chitin deacetylase (PgdA/CDA1 family)